MKYYSTNGKAPLADLKKAVVKGLAEDRGLYMPERIEKLPQAFFNDMKNMSFQDIAYNVAANFFGEDVDADALQDLVFDTLSFDCPIVKVEGLLQYFLRSGSVCSDSVAAHKTVNVLVATSGDTGSAVANGFLGVEGIHVYVLYPKGKVSPIQECQFTTLGKNITAIEVDGVFDDCQALVKNAFMDAELNQHMMLTSANSGLLLLQCSSPSFSPQPSDIRHRDVRSLWQLWQHLCCLVRPRDGSAYLSFHRCQQRQRRVLRVPADGQVQSASVSTDAGQRHGCW